MYYMNFVGNYKHLGVTFNKKLPSQSRFQY